MHPLKAPGPDGMSPGFFQHFWPVVGKGVIEACLEFLNNAYSASLTWKGIWEARYILQVGCRRRIGNGRSTRVWEDPWLPGSSCFNVVTPRPNGCEVEWVSELIDDVTHSWRRELVDQLFSEYEAQILSNHPPLQASFEDRLCGGWSYQRGLKFSFGVLIGIYSQQRKTYFARAVWLGSQLNLRVADLQVDSFAEFFDTVALTVDQSKLELFRVVCWSLWNNRNDILWESKRQQPQQVCEMAVRFLQEYAEANSKEFGVGAVVRDCNGEVIAAMSCRRQGTLRVEAVEAYGLLLLSKLGGLLEDCKGLMDRFNECRVQHVRRAGNQVAHELARRAEYIAGDEFWVEEVPDPIKAFVLNDMA
ncbi:hypothetical protein SLE2022_128760 [Rubroshorea leprosula]